MKTFDLICHKCSGIGCSFCNHTGTFTLRHRQMVMIRLNDKTVVTGLILDVSNTEIMVDVKNHVRIIYQNEIIL